MRCLRILALVTVVAASAARAEVVLRDKPLTGVARELGYFPAADGTPLAYVAYGPAAQGRYPTVVWFDVYGAGSLPPLGMVTEWVNRGYAFVGGSVRGTGCSGGEYVPFNQRQDAVDGARFVEWAGAQPWSTGKVGLVGNSQPGILEFGIAAQQPRHLVAIAPGGTISRLYADGWYPGGVFHSAIAAHWSYFDQPGASRGGAETRVKLGDLACRAALGRIGPNPLLKLLRAERFDGAYYRQGSPYDLAPEVRVPTLMVQSWTDPAVGSSALWVFDRISARHKRLFVLDGSHDAYLYTTAQAEVRRWMDRWLKGVRDGVEDAPRVRVDFETRLAGPSAAYGDLIAAKAGWTVALKDWPAPDTRWKTYYLASDGSLDPKKPASASRSAPRQYFYPVGTELPGDARQFALAPLDWGSLSYRTPPMAEDTAILGSPQLRFHASSEQPDTDFMVVLHDVAPDGAVTFLQRGFLRASHRAVDRARSTPQLVFHPHLAEEPLKPGAIYEFEISIQPLAYMLRAGHALELVILAPATIPAPGWGMAPIMLPGFNTLYHDARHPSRLDLPVVPGLKAQAPAPACGERLFQPCRSGAGRAGGD